MVKKIFSQRLRGSVDAAYPQDVLLIVLSDQRLQFVVADHLWQPHLLKEYVDESATIETELLSAIFSEDEDIRKSYNTSYIVFQRPVALLEPLERESKSISSSDLTSFLLPESAGTIRLSDNVDSLGVSVIYPIKESTSSFARQMFPNLKVIHHQSILVQLFAQMAGNQPESRVFAQIDESVITVYYFKDSKIQYGNQFLVSEDADRIYYIMLIYKQFDLDPENVILSLSRGSGVTAGVIASLQSYVQNIQIVEYQPGSTPIKDNYYDKSVFQHYYLTLSGLDVLSQMQTS